MYVCVSVCVSVYRKLGAMIRIEGGQAVKE